MSVSIDKSKGIVWLNGEFIPWQAAKIHVITHGLHYASCVFEGSRAYNGTVFKMREHNERLLKSGEMLDIHIPYSVDELDEITVELLKRNSLTNAYVRPLAWCGSDCIGVSSRTCSVNTAIAAWEWPSYFSPEALNEGIKICLADWIRPDPRTAPVHAKASCLYAIATLNKNKAEKNGFDDALMLDWRGYVAECTGANIFFIIDGKIHTPIPDCFLNGITRQTIIQLAKEMAYEVIERFIEYKEIAQATEVFITGTAAEVTPVGQIVENNYQVGDITRKLRVAYLELVGK